MSTPKARDALETQEHIARRFAYALMEVKREYVLRERDIAERIGIKASQISRLKNGKSALTRNRAEKFEAEFGWSADWLLTATPPKRIGPHTREAPAFYYTDLEVAGRTAAQPSDVQWVDFELPEGAKRTGTRSILVEVNGSSLEPLARHQQHVIVDVTDRSARDGDLVVVQCRDGRCLAKRFFGEAKGMELVTVNPQDPQPPIHLQWADVTDVKVIVGVLYEH